MKWTETITPKQAAEELGVPYHGWMREMDRAWISEDQKYSVMSRLLRTEWGKVEHVTITAAEGVGRSDGSGDIPWAVKMEIKNDLFGEKRVAVEVFPTQDRLVDVCDCYHLWVFEKGFQLPFGIHPRDKKTMTVNRGSTRVRAIDGAGREHSIKELLEENGAADVPTVTSAKSRIRRLISRRCTISFRPFLIMPFATTGFAPIRLQRWETWAARNTRKCCSGQPRNTRDLPMK